MGIDLLQRTRDMVYFHAGDMMAVLDKHYYLIKKGSNVNLYDYNKLSTENIYSAHKLHADSMMAHSFTFLQTANWMMQNRKVKYIKAH